MNKKRIAQLLLVTLCISPIGALGYEAKRNNSFIRKLFLPNDLVFDVGAHIGTKTQLYLDHGARVLCIEPQPNCYALLKEKFNGNKKIHMENIGLAHTHGSLTLSVCSSSNTLSTCSAEWSKNSRHANRGYVWDTKITIHVNTLNTMIQKYGTPQFCKIDVEGFEYEVLMGLSQPIPCLSFEFHIEFLDSAKKCLELLDGLGYSKFNLAAGEIQQFVFQKWLDKATLIKRISSYSKIYLTNEKDPLWGDIYAKYP